MPIATRTPSRRDILWNTGAAAGALGMVALGFPRAAHAAGQVVWAANSGECDPADVARFQNETSIAVDYREVIADADQFFASVKPQLAAGLPIGYDLVCVSTSYVSIYANNGWLEKLDQSALPNVTRYLLPTLKDVPFADVAIPYDFAPVGIAYNRGQFASGLTSWGQLLDPSVKGKVGLYPTPVVNIAAWGLYLKAQGKVDNVPAKMTLDEAMRVLAFLKPYIASGHLLTAQGENAGQKLSNGDLVVAVAPPVNISQLDPAKVAFVVPDEGAPAYIDRLAVPKGAANPAGAQALINWWFDPKNAASFSRYTLQYPYATGVKEELAKQDPKLAGNPLIFPDQSTLNRLHAYPGPWTDQERAQIARAWTEMTSG